MPIRPWKRFAPIVALPGAVIAAGLMLGVPGARAQDHPEMTSAQQELEAAKGHLQAVPHDYGGHRKTALEHVNKALEQIRMGLASVEHKEKRVEKKENKLEKRLNGLKGRDEQLKQ